MPYPNEYEDRLAQQGGLFEPQRQHTFVLRVMLADALGTLAAGAETLELSTRTAFLPSESSEEIEIPHMNGRVYVAGKYMYEAGSVTFNDYLDKNTANVIVEWRKQVCNPAEGSVGLARNYKKKAEIVMFAPDFSTERYWELHGLWPQNVVYGTLDYATSDVVQIEVTFRYDKAIPKLG